MEKYKTAKIPQHSLPYRDPGQKKANFTMDIFTTLQGIQNSKSM